MSFLCLLLCGLGLPALLPGQDKPVQAPAPDARFESPFATMWTFMRSMEVGDQATAVSCLESGNGENTITRRKQAKTLHEVITALGPVKGTYLDGKECPRNKPSVYFPKSINFGAVMTQLGIREGAYETVAFSWTKEGWKFSKATLHSLSTLSTLVQELAPVKKKKLNTIPGWIEAKVPAVLNNKFLSLQYWQWLGILLVVFLGVFLDFFVRFLLRMITKRIIARYHTYVEKETMARAVRPIGLCAAAFLWLILLPLLGLEGTALTVLLAAARVFAVLAGTWASWRLVDLIAEACANKAKMTASKLDDVLIPLVRKSIKVFIIIFGVIYAAESLNLEIGPLLASLGIGGLAFAFAAKDTVENFFGSVAVLLDRPFHVGDWVVIGEVEGIVEEVGFRSTRIRTFYNSLVTLPNSTLVKAQVDNYGERKYRRTKCHIGVQYGTPPETLLAFREGIMELVRIHPYTRKDYYQIWFHQFGPSSLDILLYIFFEVPDWSTELRERERLFLDILRLADKLGVEIAFPTQTVHLFKGEEGGGKSTIEPPSAGAGRKALLTGVRAVRELTKSQPWIDEKPGPVTYVAGPTQLDDDPEEEGIPGEEMRET